MSKRIDRTGMVYGRLTVLEVAYVKNATVYWKCKCECGNEVVVKGGNLQSGNTTSCGCLGIANRQRQMDVFTAKNKTHGHGHTRLSRIWYHMKERCNNPNSKDYDLYGGRGISVCDEWNGSDGFQAFYQWSMENGYDDNLSIDRIDTDGNYEPGNCQWSNDVEQANNRRSNRMLTINGKTQTFAEWCRQCNIKYHKVRDRMESGWTAEEALELKPRE